MKPGGSWTREALAARLFSKSVREPVRKAWLDFNAKPLAVYAAWWRMKRIDLNAA